MLTEEYLYYLQLEQNFSINERELLNELSLGDIKKVFKKINIAEKIVERYGITKSSIKSVALQCSKTVKNLYKKGTTPEEASKEISNIILEKSKNNLKLLSKKVNELSIGEKIFIALIMIYILLVFSSIISTVLAVFVDQETLISITTIIVAPMLEEALKSFFINMNMPWTGTAVVFGIELIQYVIMILLTEGKLVKALLVRAAGLLMHFTTTFIQKKLIDAAKGSNHEEVVLFAAWLSGVCIHVTWNFIAVKYNTQLTGWLNK